jgi:large subunit ribosomal protein L22
MTKAILKNYRQSSRKVRLVADAVRGKSVEEAILNLRFMTKRASDPIKKVIESALANAKNNSVPTEGLIIKEISVNGGVTLKRWMPRARGSASAIKKRTSHISVVLGHKGVNDTPVVSKKAKTVKTVEETKEVAKKAPVVKTKKVTKAKK